MSDITKLETLGVQGKRDSTKARRPMPEWLDIIDNLNQGVYLIPFFQQDTTFRSKCPKTGQVDSAKIEILYVPNKVLVESKALKEYLGSYQNFGEFHEDCINRISKDLMKRLGCKYVRVFGQFVTRGDLAIHPLVELWGKQTSPIEAKQIDKLVNVWDIRK